MFRNPPTWHLYPVDIPVERRPRCTVAECDLPGEVVEVQAHLRGTLPRIDPTTTIYCLTHGRIAGYERPSRVLPPEHLNVFQRLVVHAFDRGDAMPRQCYSS
jgi:hypothetical protein